jgi:hypothetical protein
MDEQNVPTQKAEEASAQSERDDVHPGPMTSPTDLWGDQRMNPMFLKVADYFGVGEKDYKFAESKLRTIIDWAAAETKSKNTSDILLKISEMSRSLQSPGWGERRYAILYRYVRLLGEEAPIKQQMSKLEEKLSDIDKEKRAYGNA